MLSDSQFLEQLVAHRSWMGGVAFRMGVAAYDDREDIVQDSTLRAWEFRSQLEGDSRANFRAWLATIIRNTCFSQYRRSRSRTHTSDHLVLDALANPDPAPSEIDLARFVTRLTQVLPALSQQHRTVIMASFLDDATYIEIAQAMNCELGTVRSSLFRARARLRELMGEEMYRVCAESESPETYLSFEISGARPKWFESMEPWVEEVTEQEA